jgi:hypothetical protein
MEGLHHPDHNLGGAPPRQIGRGTKVPSLPSETHDGRRPTHAKTFPIWIFTHDQWNRVQNDRLIVSAAPFPSSELGHNRRFVFALPPRYSYDELSGFEEVLKINANHPLHPY